MAFHVDTLQARNKWRCLVRPTAEKEDNVHELNDGRSSHEETGQNFISTIVTSDAGSEISSSFSRSSDAKRVVNQTIL